MTADVLFTAEPPWFLTASLTNSGFCDALWSGQRSAQQKMVTRVVRGAKMQTAANLFDEFAAAFQFPYYFGENWNAWDECMRDLSWLPAPAYLLAISQATLALREDSPAEWAVFLRLLSGICEAWSMPISKGEPWDRGPVPFHVVFQATRGDVRDLRMDGFEIGELSL